MRSVKDLIRKDLLGFEPYNEQFMPCKYKLNANESPYNVTDFVKKEMLNWLEKESSFNIYPDSDSTQLRESLAEFWGLSAENFICGVGSDQVIDFITKVFIENDDIIVIPTPTFSMYALTGIINRAKIVKVDCDYNINPRELIDTVKQNNAKILFLCNPNNPTGTEISRDAIMEILHNVDCTVVLDEAYGEFSDFSLIPLVNNYENLIVLRTFSKAYSLAGIRVGYGVGGKNIINAVNIVKTPYNLPSFSEKIAILALKDNKEYRHRIDYLNKQRDILFENLKEISWLKVYPSKANFLFIKSEKEVSHILEEKGILIRRFPKTQEYSETLRITVGTAEQNEEILKIFREL